MMMVFTMGFGTDKLASDCEDRDVAIADRCLRINVGNTACRNIISICLFILCGNSWNVLCFVIVM